jgi:hypothetical protein
MANVRLEVPETAVIPLIRQLSPESKQIVWRMLASELGEPGDLTFLEEDEEVYGLDEEDELWTDYPAMDRQELLAAETFHYSYANYDDHLGIGNVRFDKLMPDDVDTLEQAEEEGWDDARLARALEVAEDKVEFWRESYRRAKDVIDAPTPAESFRRGVRYSILDALEEGLADEGAVERLVTQICYRAADLAYLLDREDEILSSYSEELRAESAADLEDLIDE